VTVELRGGAPDRAASAVTALDQGLEVRFGEPGKPETREVIPWDEVRGISDPSSRNAAADFLAMAEDLWRARLRVARRDAALAHPLLERHWPRLRGASGPTAQLVAEGLLRAAVESRDLNGAVGPWIACLRLGTEGTPAAIPDGKATQSEAEAGTSNEKWMTPLRTMQAIAAFNTSAGIGFMPAPTAP
jgi:hypothetical protein